MRYIYYPGCSLEGTAREYDASTRSVLRALGAELIDVEDWTCCGASAAEPLSYLLSIVLPARNLALVQRMGMDADILVPCSACYLNLRKVDDHFHRDGQLATTVNSILADEELRYDGGLRVRHLLDVIARDVDADSLASRVQRSLSGLRIAPYYGCQCLRPYNDFDHPEQPRSMEPVIAALGAEVFPWTMGGKCCGAGFMTTKQEVAAQLTGTLLEAAQGADCIVTVCPMCQMNLDGYQRRLSRRRGADLHISVLYLPQLMGWAMGLPRDSLQLDSNLALTASFRNRLQAQAQ